MSFNDFIDKCNFRNKATSNVKIQKILSSLSLNDVGIYLGDGPFKFDIGIVNLHPLKRTHWIVYLDENYFNSYGCAPPQKLSDFNIKGIGACLHSEHKNQGLTNKKDSSCASYCLYIYYINDIKKNNT